MTTPTTDADRDLKTMQAIERVLLDWQPTCGLTDAEALAKVRALLSGGEPASVRVAVGHALREMRERADYRDDHPKRDSEMQAEAQVMRVWADRIEEAMVHATEGEPPCMWCDGHGCHGPLLESGDPTPCEACEGTGIETPLHSLLGELDALAAALLRDDCEIDIVGELRRIAKHHAIPRGEPAKVRDESLARIASRLEEIAEHGGDVTLDDGGPGMLALAGQLHDLAGYAPQGAPPLPDGWGVDRCTGDVAPFWRAFRERDAGTIEWADDGALTQDVNVAEDSWGDEILAVLQHLAARRAK